MANAIGQVLPMAIGVALSPIPIIAVVLMLVSAKGRVNGPVFVVGWLVGLAIVGAIVMAVLAPSESASAGASSGSNTVLLVLGLLLVVVAFRQWQKRPAPGTEPESPKWMATIDSFTPVKAFGFGAIFAGLNPKNLLLAAGAAVSIAQTQISGTEQAIAYGVFAIIASIGVAAPVVIYFTMGDRAQALLDDLKVWMGHNNAVIMSVLCLVIGAKLIGQGMGGI